MNQLRFEKLDRNIVHILANSLVENLSFRYVKKDYEPSKIVRQLLLLQNDFKKDDLRQIDLPLISRNQYNFSSQRYLFHDHII